MQPTFEKLIKEVCVTFQDETLIFDVSGNRSLSYENSLDLIHITSGRLQSCGIQKGDIIMNLCPLSLESVLLCWASLYQGSIFLPVDHNWTLKLVEQVIVEAKPKFILTDPIHTEEITRIVPEDVKLVSGKEGFFTWLEEGDQERRLPYKDIDPQDPGIILYTSGSTGTPKGVVISQSALWNSGKLIAEFFGWQKRETFMNLGDLHSMSGLRNTCIAPLFEGSSMIIAEENERNAVLHVIDLVQKLDVKYIGVAPTLIRQFNLLYTDLRKEQLSPLKAIMCTAGYLPKDQLREFYTKYGIPVFNYYGLTETSGICAGHNMDTFSPDDNSIGAPVGANFILLPEDAYDDPSIGQLLVKSENLMTCYYKRPEETRAVLSENGFLTGDIVKRRSDGCYELLGRKKNFIKSISAELIHLEEIDRALELYPGIKEACAVKYAKHEEDERIVAFIVIETGRGSEEDYMEGLKNHMNIQVGSKRCPWFYFIKEDLPRNTPGKIERKKLEAEVDVLIRSGHKRYF